MDVISKTVVKIYILIRYICISFTSDIILLLRNVRTISNCNLFQTFVYDQNSKSRWNINIFNPMQKLMSKFAKIVLVWYKTNALALCENQTH